MHYPCRHCLCWAQPGERMILFPFASIPAGRPYAESGPIFVHADSCEQYADTQKYPSAFRSGRVLRAYDRHEMMIDARVLNGEAPERVIESLFENPQTKLLQARSASRGCFTMRIEREQS